MARIPVVEIDEVHVFTSDEPFRFVARDAWQRAGRRGTSGPWVSGARWDAARDWIDAGVVADPLEIREADLRTFSPDELRTLEHAALLPNVIAEHVDGLEPRTLLRAQRPCVTSLP